MTAVIKHPWVTEDDDSRSPYARWPYARRGSGFRADFQPESGWGEKNSTFPIKLEAAGYRLEYKIGSGAYGSVFKAWKRNQPMACKVVDIKKANEFYPQYAKRYTKELDIIRSYDHLNLCKVYDVFIEKNRRGRESTKKKGEDRRVFIFMELCIGDLIDVCCANDGSLHEIYARRYLQGVAQGMKYLHTKRVAHRDMKMDNILARSKSQACVTDFSYSKETPHMVPAGTFIGTLEYRCPEILAEKPYDPYSADVWAYGCCIALAVTGHYLFDVPVENRNAAAMREEVTMFRDKINAAEVSDQARDLIRKCVAWKEKDRIPFVAIIYHEWFRTPAEELTYETWPTNSIVPHPNPKLPPHPLRLP